MASQTVNGLGGANNLSIASNVTTGTVNLGGGQTSGTLNIGTNTGRTGSLLIGNAASSGNIEVDAGTSSIVFRGGGGITMDDTVSFDTHEGSTVGAPVRLADNTTTGNMQVFNSQTSGTMQLCISAARTGQIQIGNDSSSGDVFLRAGSGQLILNGSGNINIGSTLSTQDMTLFSGQTSGTMQCAAAGTRTGPINIGNLNSSGDINIDAGSGALNLDGASGIVCGDTITTNGTITGPDAGTNCNYFTTTTTGNVNVAPDVTSGTIAIGTNTTRSGLITLGTLAGGSVGGVQIFANSGGINISSNSGTVLLNTTSGAIQIGENQTSGTMRLWANTGRSSTIVVGNGASTGDINIDAGSGTLNLNGSGGIVCGDTITTNGTIAGPDTGTSCNYFTTTTTGNVTIAPNITSGVTGLANQTGRSGDIKIGHPSSSGDIDIDAGSSRVDIRGGLGLILGNNTDVIGYMAVEDLRGPAPTIAVNLWETTTTGTMTIGAAQTSANMRIGYASTRTGIINIGNPGSSGNIAIDAGSGSMTLDAGGDILCNNLLEANNGITFDSGTNTMSNFEEGSWSPAIGISGGSDWTMTTQAGRYQRIGNWCHIQGQIVYSAIVGTGSVAISDLPFNLAATLGLGQTFTVGVTNCISSGNDYTVYGFGIGATDQIALFQTNANTGTDPSLNEGDFDATGVIRFSGSYLVA